MEQEMTVIGNLLTDFIEKYGREVLAEVSDEKKRGVMPECRKLRFAKIYRVLRKGFISFGERDCAKNIEWCSICKNRRWSD